MGSKMRRVSLLGAFEIAAEADPAVRDGLILGSRRDAKGFVLETSRENIEQIVSASTPAQGVPERLTQSLVPMLERLACEPVRVELRPMIPIEGDANGSFVQGLLIFKGGGRTQRLKMTATEAIQVAIACQLPMLAAAELLQLDVSQFLAEIDEVTEQYEQETESFRSFVDTVTATDFAQYLEEHRPSEDED